MRRFSTSVCLCSLLALAFAGRAAAQSDVVAVPYVYASSKLTAGDVTFGQVLRIVGLNSSIGAAGGSSNPTTVDSSGDVWKSVTTSVNSVDQWTWGSLGKFADALIVTSSTNYDAAVGTTGLYFYKNASTPRVKWEVSGTGKSFISDVDTSGNWRLFRVLDSGAADSVPLAVNGNIIVQPYGKFFLPGQPYSVSIGSPGMKFDAFWASNAFFDTLVATKTMATIDGRQLIGLGNIFDEDLAPAGTTITVRYNNISSGDYLVAEKNGRREAFKATSGATTLNKVVDPSFEVGVSNWDVSASDSINANTAKAWDNNASALLTAAGSTLLQIAQKSASFTPATSTTYTFCGYFRRDDAAIPVVGDVQVTGGQTSGLVNMTVEDTQTDGWTRMCGTFTTPGTLTDNRAPFINWTTTNGASSHSWNLDAFQLETGTKARPYSTSRATYTVTRNLDSTVANQWWAGDSLFDLFGTAGKGWLEGYAESGLGGSSQVGPTWLANVRTASTNWNDYEPYAGWGNLNGWWGYGADTFGFVAGPNSGYHATFDNVNGIAFWSGASKISSWDLSSGTIRIGDFTTGHSSVRLTSTDLIFCANGILCPLTLKGASGEIWGGSATAINTGTGFFLGGATSAFRVGNPAADYLRWDGSNVTVISTNLTINNNGISMAASGAISCARGYSFSGGNIATCPSTTGMFYDTTVGALYLTASQTAGNNASIVISATPNSVGSNLQISLDGSTSKMQLYAGAGIIANANVLPESDNAENLGGASFRWKDVYIIEHTTGTALFPLVSNSGHIEAKNDGVNGSFVIGGNCTIVVEFGIITGHSGAGCP